MSGHTDGEVRLERIGYVAHVIIDRPVEAQRHDRGDGPPDERPGLRDQQRQAGSASVLLSGAGERAFCAGSDITDLDEYGDNWSYRNRFDARGDYARAVWLIRKPVVAAVHGYCIGGGLEMAAASDIRIGTPDATFGAGEINWGWHGGSGADAAAHPPPRARLGFAPAPDRRADHRRGGLPHRTRPAPRRARTAPRDGTGPGARPSPSARPSPPSASSTWCASPRTCRSRPGCSWRTTPSRT